MHLGTSAYSTSSERINGEFLRFVVPGYAQRLVVSYRGFFAGYRPFLPSRRLPLEGPLVFRYTSID